MQRFANTRDFQVTLLQVIRHANDPHPSRHVIAEQLESLAERLGATRKKSPGGGRKKSPTSPAIHPVQRSELINIGKEEHKALESLGFLLHDALGDVSREVRDIKEAIRTLEEDATMDGLQVADDAREKAWWENTRWLAGEVIGLIQQGVETLADTLIRHTSITQEEDLADAVADFAGSIPRKYGGNWPEGKGEKLFHDVEKAIKKAIDKVPAGLSKPSELGNLRQVFDAIAEAVKLMTGKSISVPKIPNALDPEDPRQLGFGFAASRRIANCNELRARLDRIWRVASEPQPSRLELGAALFAVADSLR